MYVSGIGNTSSLQIACGRRYKFFFNENHYILKPSSSYHDVNELLLLCQCYSADEENCFNENLFCLISCLVMNSIITSGTITNSNQQNLLMRQTFFNILDSELLDSYLNDNLFCLNEEMFGPPEKRRWPQSFLNLV